MSRAALLGASVLMALAVHAFASLPAFAAQEDKVLEESLHLEVSRRLQLSEEEWRQYQTLRDLLGSPLESLTPYEVLGMYTDDAKKRRSYARKNARFMLDIYRRTMAFEEIYREEMRKMTPKD